MTQRGNAELENIPSKDRFISQWVVIPDIYGRLMSHENMVAEMKGKNVSSVRLWSSVYDHSLK